MTALAEQESRGDRLRTPGVKIRKIVRAVFIRNRVPLAVLACLFVASALIIHWLSLGIVVKTSSQTYENPQYLLYFRLLVFSLPFLVGVLGGAPLLATEYESGTFRFTQTQGVGRRRLLLVTLVSYLLLLIAGSGFVSLAIGQFYRADSPVQPMPIWAIGGFFSQPLLFVAMVVACFCAGVFIGAVVRRTVAGITAAVTTLSIGALLIYVELFQKSLVFMSSSVTTNFDSFQRHAYLIADWVENGHGQRIVNGGLLSPAQFQILHVTRHYTFWVQFVLASRYHSVQLLWAVIFLLIAVVGIIGAFIRLGGKDRLLTRPKATDQSLRASPSLSKGRKGEEGGPKSGNLNSKNESEESN
jgi:hypothetical protein